MPRPKRDDNGQFSKYAWPGGYPLIYVTADGGELCPDCANRKNGSEAGLEGDIGTEHFGFPPYAERPLSLANWEDKQWILTEVYIHYEGSPVFCDHCNATIESAYGNPDDNNEA